MGCWNINDATEAFVDGAMEALAAPNFAQKQETIYKVIQDIKRQADNAGLSGDYSAVMQMIDENIEDFDDLKAITVGYKNIFNSEFNQESWESRHTEVDGEETDSDKVKNKKQVRSAIIKKQFQDSEHIAARALLYFQRDAKLQLISAFIADRNHGRMISAEEIPERIREFKQQLLDTVVSYLKSTGYTDTQLGTTQLFNNGAYQDILAKDSLLSQAISAKLELGNNFNARFITQHYNNYVSEKNGWQQSKQFLDAYFAKTLLENFDDMVTISIGTLVKPGQSSYGHLSNNDYQVQYHKATNMWSTGFGDENANIADLVSDITQDLIATSRKYNWRGEAMKDQYLTFQDFNHIVAKVKKFVHDSKASSVIFNDTFFQEAANKNSKLTDTTWRTINTIKALKRKQRLPEDVSFSDVLAFISDNPQRHLHSIFDLLCNTNLVDHLSGLDTNDKNLIWSVGKEIFGSWNSRTDPDGNITYSRSLFDLHHNTKGDTIFEIITQYADSMFADEFLQYYEDAEGTLKVRVLQDYARQLAKNELFFGMKQTHGLLDTARFQRYLGDHNIEIEYDKPKDVKTKYGRWQRTNDQKVTEAVKGQFIKSVKIPIGKHMTLQYSNGRLADFHPQQNVFTKDFGVVWKSDEFRSYVKDTIGIDFNTNVELASAYEEAFKTLNDRGVPSVDYVALVTDLSKICAAVTYNQAFNNVVVPTLLKTAGRNRTTGNIEALVNMQYHGQTSKPRINRETGVVEMLNDSVKDAYLEKLATAQATIRGILTSAQVKTGENTAIASNVLSCLRSSYPYQLAVQNKNEESATRHITFVNNDGFFRGVVSRREAKLEYSVKANTKMSAKEQFYASLLSFVGAHINDFDSTTIARKGICSIIPAVYSDKSRQDELLIDLSALNERLNKTYVQMTDSELEDEMRVQFGTMYKTVMTNVTADARRLLDTFGVTPTFSSNEPVILCRETIAQLSDTLCSDQNVLIIARKKAKSTREQELVQEIDRLEGEGYSASQIVDYIIKRATYNAPNLTDADVNAKKLYGDFREILGKYRKKQIGESMYQQLCSYNRTHRTKPIEVAEQVHYLYDKDGRLVPNNTLIALYGRFNLSAELNKKFGITSLYSAEHENAATVDGYFKYEKDLSTAEELLKDEFSVYLRGRLAREKQKELAFIRETYPDWETKSGKMAIARVFIPNTRYEAGDTFYNPNTEKLTHQIMAVEGVGSQAIYTVNIFGIDGSITQVKYNQTQLDNVKQESRYTIKPPAERQGHWEICEDLKTFQNFKNYPGLEQYIQVHPLLTKLNRVSYLAAQQYTSCVGGAHYVYKGKGADILEEEASRWLASNKRNVCYASTVHKYQNKTLTGVPKRYNIAPIEDIKSVIYSIMGNMSSHAPLDGGMFVNPWFWPLENNALAGEAAGVDKKQFGTYYYEKLCAGGIIKTAGFASTNQRMRRSETYRTLTKNMTDRTWIKEFADQNGADIQEFLDITRDYDGNILSWIQDKYGKATYYSRDIDDQGHVGRFKLDRVEAIYRNEAGEEQSFEGEVPEGWTPTNKYRIYEFPVNKYGEIDSTHPVIAKQLLDNPYTPLKSIQRTFGSDLDANKVRTGEFTINTNWKLYNLIFGGYNSLDVNERGELVDSEHSIFQMVDALNNIGYRRDTKHNDERFGDERYTEDNIDEIHDQDDVWQPLKYSDVSYAPNIGALKSTQMNVNPSEALDNEQFLNSMQIMMAQLGIQLDKEHHADESELSMPTQIISACANKGYTINYASPLYHALSTLTELGIEDCMKGVMEYMPGGTDQGTLVTEVAQIIVNNLIRTQDDNSAIEAAMGHIISKVEAGGKLTPEDVQGKIAWSDSKLYHQIFSSLSVHLSNTAVKMKFPGTLAVICPTEKMEQLHGNKRLNQYQDLDRGISEDRGLLEEQNAIRDGLRPKQLIYDTDENFDATVMDKLSLASALDTQHHYWVEWADENGEPIVDIHGYPYREDVLIDTPEKYIQLKEWIAYDGKTGTMDVSGTKVSRKGKKVLRVYENIMAGRELGAYNVRFGAKTSDGKGYAFNVFDLSSVQQLFNYNKFEQNYDTAKTILADERFFERKDAINYIERLIDKNNPAIAKLIVDRGMQYPKWDITEVIESFREDAKQNPAYNEVEKQFVAATFKVCKVLTYKRMQEDLFKISKDYQGNRRVLVNDEMVTVDPESIVTKAYELIMPKVYQTKFGLRAGDTISDILSDQDFFTKRALNEIRDQKVPEECFHYELKNFNGKHVYIWDTRLGKPDPSIFHDKPFYARETEKGKWERFDIDGNSLHGMASGKDKIMQVGKMGYEVIVTDNPSYYFNNIKYNLAAFSNKTITEDNITNLVSVLKDSKVKRVQRFIHSLTDYKGNLRNFRALQVRNQAFATLDLEGVAREQYEISELRREFVQEGYKLHSSFSKSLDIIAGRIPAQSQQSFMPQRVVAFDNNDINTAYVSTFQLFLQGSDLDIDCVNLLGSEFDENGEYVMWSPLADISSIENLEASQQLPFPTGVESEVTYDDNQPSFFTTFDDHIFQLFTWERSERRLPDGTYQNMISVTKEGYPKLVMKRPITPEQIKLLGEMLEQATTLNIKGIMQDDGTWKPNEAFEDEWNEYIYKEGKLIGQPNSLKLLGFKTPEGAYNALQQIKSILDSHYMYIRTADKKTREKMAKNRCVWAMYEVCSAPSNLVESMIGLDETTSVIKGKGGAVDLSPYKGDDAKVSPGNYYNMFQSFQTGQVGKDCVGIGAVTIKVDSGRQYYMDEVLRTGTEEELNQLPLPKVDDWGKLGGNHRYYMIGGKPRYGMINLYDKVAETTGVVPYTRSDGVTVMLRENLPENVKEILAWQYIPDGYTPNASMSLAAMLSVAVDF